MHALAETFVEMITVEVVASPREGTTVVVKLALVCGSTTRDATQRSGLLEQYAALAGLPAGLGIWGKPCGLNQVLVNGDRIEIYRPIQIDPKEARRRRANSVADRLKQSRKAAKSA